MLKFLAQKRKEATMNRIIILLLGFLIITNTTIAQPSIYLHDLNWQLILWDDFNSFDDTKWIKANFCDHSGADTVRKPYVHRENNVFVANGNLVVRTNSNATNCQTGLPCPSTACGRCCPSGWSYNYTGGWVETMPNYYTKFGYIEAKIKMTSRPGVGYAFWTFRTNEPSHNAAEIDIYETSGKHLSNQFGTHIHFVSGTDPFGIQHEFSNYSCTDWHTYAVEWDANRIIWYLDGVAIRTLYHQAVDPEGYGIIDPVRTIFSAGVHPKYLAPPYSTAPFEEYMYVDSVQIYQLRCSPVPVTEILNYDNPQLPNYYDYGVKKSISLSGISSLTFGQKVSLRASDYIELTNGFEVPLGAELYLDINSCGAHVVKKQE